MYSLEERIDNLYKFNLKYFYHEDFDKKSKINCILSEIPDKLKFDRDKNKVINLRVTNKQPEMRPCYEEPLLTKEQEQHLFKQLNYHKFYAKKLLSELNLKKINIKKIDKIESLLVRISFLRNKIASSNFRLVTYILRTDLKHHPEVNAVDIYLSDAYMDIIKSVDYFNFTLGNKFSTYCIWVLRKNFYRMLKTKKSKEDMRQLDDNSQDNISSPENFLSTEVHQRENATYINRILNMAKDKLNTRDINRQIMIVEHYFGINGKERKNLEEISKILCITKERVRQLKEKLLVSMREIARHRSEDVI